ncbi:autoinducer binding domain-containing protein [Janthinobacterium sp. PSPC3-1]|uniref:helix-turn-helix transcriptional regulator n=1 Tax=Janthinobacterium sp. PSPC3-1 TaxID=2804653 RepID=UPI003CF46273
MTISHSSAEVLDVICQLAECTTEAGANELVMQVVKMLGAESFVYCLLLPSVDTRCNGSMRYSIGCSPELCALYSKRMWMLTDPFLEYARTNSAPLVGSKVKVQTPGQAELIRLSAQHGFRSGLVVPTHTSTEASKRMGLLYIGSELPADVGEPLLMSKRIQFGALGGELLLWWNLRLRQQAMRQYSLVDEEIETLQLSKDGKVATEIAAIFDIKLAAAYKRLNEIKEKLDVEKMKLAVLKADALGLLG